jgi:hypothetical protein
MNGLYFDVIGGASGDMLLSVLVNLGCPLKFLREEFKKIGLEFRIKKEKINFMHTESFRISFSSKKDINFTYKEVLRLIERSRLREGIKDKVIDTYRDIFYAEKAVHRTRGVDFDFHHLGRIDAILEITGFYLALDYFKVDSIYVSNLPLAKPSPATLELLRGKRIRILDYEYESITPTAAALLKKAEQTQSIFCFKKYAFSFGNFLPRDYLVVYLGEENSLVKDRIIKIETNIDDMNPQLFENLLEQLYNGGAKEVYIEQIVTKKSRPAFVLNVLCLPQDFIRIRNLIFASTSTFGLRYQEYFRDKLNYKFMYKNTKLGRVRFRVSLSGFKKETPEYQDCVKIAKKLDIPLLEVYRRIGKEV